MCVYSYIQTYIHTYIHTYTYACMVTNKERERERERFSLVFHNYPDVTMTLEAIVYTLSFSGRDSFFCHF